MPCVKLLVGPVAEDVEDGAAAAEVFLEHRVPVLLLAGGVVGLVAVGLPLHEHPVDPLLLPPLPVRHDRHVRRRHRQQQQRRRRRLESRGPPHLRNDGTRRGDGGQVDLDSGSRHRLRKEGDEMGSVGPEPDG